MSGQFAPIVDPPRRILITGSRTWDDMRTIKFALMQYDDPADPVRMTLVSGACPTGADRLAEVCAQELGWTIERHPADWEHFGKRAGFMRNVEMAKAGADVCLAFHRDNSRGTTHMINAATKEGIPVTEYIYTGVIAGGWGT